MKFFSKTILLATLVSTASAFSSMIGAGGKISLDERMTRDVRTLNDWAKQYGVQYCDGFTLGTYDEVDYFACSNNAVTTGSPILYVPSNMIISADAVGQEFGGSLQQAESVLQQAQLQYQIPLFRIFVKILVEYEKGSESPYYPWLNALPRLFKNGAAMTNACFEALPPYAGYLTQKEKHYSQNFRKVVQMLPFLSDETKNDLDLMYWAYNVAVTRSMEWNGDRKICPMGDYFNHSADPEVDISFDNDGSLVVNAARDVPAGTPLRFCYADPSNPTPLFATFGFLDESAPASFCKTMDKLEEMQELGYTFSNLLFYKETGDISPEVYDVVLYSILKRNDPNSASDFYKAVMNRDEAAKNNYHQQYFQYTLEELRHHVDSTLQELDFLSNKARGYDVNTHPRVPVILQHNSHVRETFQRVKDNLDRM